MSVRRLAGTTAAMGGIGGLLAAVAPHPVAAAVALLAPQHLADTVGPGAVVLDAAALLAWLVWAWGTLGLGLTAVGALPGILGALARGLARLVVPAGARRAAALALGVGLGLNAPLVVGTALASVPASSPVAAAPATAAPNGDPAPGPIVPDWPTGPTTSAPATPSHGSRSAPAPSAAPAQTPATTHLVVRGDCLWRIARADLAARGRQPTTAEVATAVHAWWSTNEDVIGPDPDLLRPGQVLRAPDAPGGRP